MHYTKQLRYGAAATRGMLPIPRWHLQAVWFTHVAPCICAAHASADFAKLCQLEALIAMLERDFEPSGSPARCVITSGCCGMGQEGGGHDGLLYSYKTSDA